MTVPIVDAPLGHSSQVAMGKCRGEKKVWGGKRFLGESWGCGREKERFKGKVLHGGECGQQVRGVILYLALMRPHLECSVLGSTGQEKELLERVQQLMMRNLDHLSGGETGSWACSV